MLLVTEMIYIDVLLILIIVAVIICGCDHKKPEPENTDGVTEIPSRISNRLRSPALKYR